MRRPPACRCRSSLTAGSRYRTRKTDSWLPFDGLGWYRTVRHWMMGAGGGCQGRGRVASVNGFGGPYYSHGERVSRIELEPQQVRACQVTPIKPPTRNSVAGGSRAEERGGVGASFTSFGAERIICLTRYESRGDRVRIAPSQQGPNLSGLAPGQSKPNKSPGKERFPMRGRCPPMKETSLPWVYPLPAGKTRNPRTVD